MDSKGVGEDKAAQSLFSDSNSGGGSNFKVVVRVRPLVERESEEDSVVAVSSEATAVSVTTQTQSHSQASRAAEQSFVFDRVFGPESAQRDVYDTAVSPVVASVLDGYNGSIIAYGQTSTGKTHTIEGTTRGEQRGIIPRAVDDVFAAIQESSKQPGHQWLVRISFLQIYNEKVSDLLRPPSTENENLRVRSMPSGSVYVEGLSEKVARNARDVMELLKIGKGNRTTFSTKMNRASSRSHAIFTIIVEHSTKQDDGRLITIGKLHLVDLAGSERYEASEGSQQRLREAQNINTSLSTFGKVVLALTSPGKHHAPYRDSKLTRILQDSLGGNCKTTMISTISPAISSASETLNTLRFASRAKLVKNNAVRNEDADGQSALIASYQAEIERLKVQLSERASDNQADELRRLQEESERARLEKSAIADQLERQQEMIRSAMSEKMELMDKIRQLEGLLTGGIVQAAPAPRPVQEDPAETERLKAERRAIEEERRKLESQRSALAQLTIQMQGSGPTGANVSSPSLMPRPPPTPRQGSGLQRRFSASARLNQSRPAAAAVSNSSGNAGEASEPQLPRPPPHPRRRASKAWTGPSGTSTSRGEEAATEGDTSSDEELLDRDSDLDMGGMQSPRPGSTTSRQPAGALSSGLHGSAGDGDESYGTHADEWAGVKRTSLSRRRKSQPSFGRRGSWSGRRRSVSRGDIASDGLEGSGVSNAALESHAQAMAEDEDGLPTTTRRFKFLTYRHCFSGTDAAEWLMANAPDLAPDLQAARDIGQQMVDRRLIKPVRGNKFVISDTTYLQFGPSVSQLRQADGASSSTREAWARPSSRQSSWSSRSFGSRPSSAVSMVSNVSMASSVFSGMTSNSGGTSLSGSDIPFDEEESEAHEAHKAAAKGDYKCVLSLVGRAGINRPDAMRRTPLMYAAVMNKARAVKALVRLGADTALRDVEGNTALLWASCRGCADACKVLLQHHARLGDVDGQGRAALHWASKLPSAKTLYALLKASNLPLVNMPDRDGLTPLHWAVASGRPDNVRLLMQHGADPVKGDLHQRTPLHYAVLQQQLDCLHVLVSSVRGQEAVRLGDRSGQTPLHAAATIQESEAQIKLLASITDDVNCRDARGLTPLHLAAAKGNEAACRALLSAGAQVMIRDERGQTALNVCPLAAQACRRVLLSFSGSNGGNAARHLSTNRRSAPSLLLSSSKA